MGGVDGAPGAGAAGPSSTGDGVGRLDGIGSPDGSERGDGSVAWVLAAAFFVAAAFLAGGSGSSGCTGRRRPSRSAFLRARSACASSMDDE
jgi:hypothetical protein